MESSTELLQHLGDSVYAEILAEHHKLLRSVIAATKGRQVSTQGDSFLAVFARASDAVAAAVAAQSAIARHPWPAGTTPRLRMGLHTGEPIVVSGEYAGLDVHRAARICAAGHGGQILLSQATSSLVAENLPPGARLRDLGSHRLKDLQEPTRIFQVLHLDLPSEFSRLTSLEALRHNLPSQLTGFVGRTGEVEDAKRLLSSRRLLTLTGAGGVGKTRLALRMAEGVVEEYPDGVWLVDLATLSDGALVVQTAASILGVREAPSHPLSATLLSFLEQKNLLIILDNCEHLTSACAAFAAMVLRRCPDVKILAASRVPLGVSGETVWSVPPLAFPDSRRLPPLENLAEYEAVKLFLERTAAIQPAFALTPDNAASVAAVCQRLDGMPLAIELAAARTSAMTVQQIAARLDDRFRLLTGGSRTALPRHQTLRGAIDWSYGLLAEKERVLLRRLSAFAGGWTLEAAEGICADADVEKLDVLDTLTQLTFKSLILVSEHSGSVRYRFLETVRQYARDRLLESDEEAAVRNRHRDWYLTFAERAEQELAGPQQAAWFDKVEAEHDNLRAALEWSFQSGELEAELRLATAVREFWYVRGYMAEGRSWLERGLRRRADAPPALRAKALRTAGWLAVFGQGDYVGGRALHEESLHLWRQLEDKRNIAQSLHDLGVVEAHLGEHAAARHLYKESLALRQEAGDRIGSAISLHNLGRVAYREGDYATAGALLQQSLAILQEAGYQHAIAMVLTNLGLVACRQGEYARARSLMRQGLALHRELGDQRRMAFSLEGFASLAAAQSEDTRAARLFGAAEALRETLGSPLPPADRPDYDRGVAAARTGVEESAFAAAWAEGRSLTPDEAIREAMDVGKTDTQANHC
jgi:non-specific serine/threonine protein kinase